MPEDMSEYMPEDMPDRICHIEDMPDRMPDRMPEDLPDRMPEDMPEDMPDRMPNKMSEDMSGNSWHGYSRLRSGREHWARMVAVEVRQGTLGADGRG